MKLTRVSKLLVLALALFVPLTLQAGKDSQKPGGEQGEKSGNVTEVDVSEKADVDVDKLVERGHTTIVDVFSEACPPCRMLSPKLDQLAGKKEGLKVLKLNIGTRQVEGGRGINWEAPVIAKYGIRGIPYLMLYGDDGKMQASGDDAYEKVLGWLKEAKLVPGR